MRSIKSLILIAILWTFLPAHAASGWYVVTYSGQAVAGPFTLLGDCTEMARVMAERYPNVSRVCQSR